MSLRYVLCILVLTGFAPAGTMALGLGDIHLKSALNAPLDADIDLTASAEELAGLKVALATRESFSRYGLDYPAYLASVTLLPGKSTDGKDVLRVRSRDVVTEPFATLLVEANWARGRLVREYTVLFDPPVFTGENASPAAAVAAPNVEPQAHSGSVARSAPEPTAVPAAAAPTAVAPAAPAPSAAGGSYLVQRGDTLFNIASRNFPAAERERALVAIYRANPQAFDGNMNVLRAGAALQLPDEASVAAIGPGDARAEVGAQYHAWAGSHGAGQLHLVTPSEPGKSTAGSASAGETAALQQRVTTLQAQLAESQRLLELKNAELARLQAQLGQGKVAPVAAPAPKPVAAPAPAPAAGPAPEAPKEPVAEAPAPPPPVAVKPAPAPKPSAAPSAQQGGSMLDWLLSNWYVPLGILAVLLAGLFGWRHMRSRQGQEFDRTLDRLSSPPFEAAARSVVRPTETQPMRALQAKEESSFLVEESGTHEAPRISGGDLGKVQAAPVAVDDTVSGDTAVALDQGDPLAEADFHMAYGLYDQAADLVRIAIAREPQRRDLKLKLLEVFFVWGNKDQFLQLARELSTSRDQALAGEWEKIVIMGRQIAPDDALFASAGALPGAASGGVDLNLEGGQNRVDFDLLGEPSIAPGTAADGVDLDLGAALGDADATGELRAIGDTGVDFVLDDPARGGDVTGTTREMPQSQTVTLDMSDAGKESPTIENLQPQGLDSPTIRQKLDAGARQHLAGVDQTAELALDDLGLDLAGGSTADTGPHGVAAAEESAAPTMLSPLDQDTRELLARSQAATHDTAEMPATPGSSASGTWLFTDKDFSSVLPQVGAAAESPTELVTAVMPAARDTSDTSDTSVTGQLQALKGKVAGSVDLNLDALATTGETSIPLDLDVGQRAVSGDTAFTATQRLTGTPPQVSEAEPATMSEVGTKLDLARAYMDMGDPEGARSILEEVLAEGSASQKTEARRLIDSLPG
jgi:pilus assembly protein FimV